MVEAEMIGIITIGIIEDEETIIEIIIGLKQVQKILKIGQSLKIGLQIIQPLKLDQ